MNFKTRFLAFSLDWFIVYLLLDLIFRENYSVYITLTDENSPIHYDLILKLLSVVGYFLLLNYFFSATLAQLLLGIKVVSFNHEKPTFQQILLRVVLYLFSIILFPTLIYLLKNPRNLALHDTISKTKLVIKND